MVENSAEYGMPVTEDANEIVFGTNNKLDSAYKQSRETSMRSGVFGGFNQS